MSSNKEFVLETMASFGRAQAEVIQAKADNMTGTELYENEDYIPDFTAACAVKNMLQRSIGFTCKSSAGRIVRLLQPYDSSIFTAEPEELPAQWGFKWSTDPAKALPFVALSTSPYMTGDCCTENDAVYRSKIDYNVFAPSAYPQGWEIIEEV